MERDDVIKALECCHKEDGVLCEKCPYAKAENGVYCANRLLRDALALIRELTEENDQLRLDVEVCGAELSRYTENVAKMVEETKADTIRKMLDMLSKKRRLLTSHDDDMVLAVDIEDIEQIAQELLGDARS